MEMLPYDELARLRMRDFWPEGTGIRSEELLSCGIGYGNGESVGFCYFLWPPSRPGELAEIRLEAFSPENCPEDVAVRIFKRLNLPLRPGMSLEEAIRLLGQPVHQRRVKGPDAWEAVHFVCGERWRYRVLCGFWDKEGLGAGIMVREDLYCD